MRFKKEIIYRLNFIKINNFCSEKDSIKRIRRQVTDWEKIFAKDTFDTGPLSKKYKEHLKVNNKKTDNPILKWAKDLNTLSSGSSGYKPACRCRRRKRCGFEPWVGKIPWRRAWQPNPVLLPGELHRQRNPAGYSPLGRKELDRTEVT